MKYVIGKCIDSSAYRKILTIGKEYKLYPYNKDGYLKDNPFITFIGDNGEEMSAYKYRFLIIQKYNKIKII